jgi:CHAT domain-containing protein/tetratricopeptide (TPR) repeat protein
MALLCALCLSGCSRHGEGATRTLLEREISILELSPEFTLSLDLPDRGLRIIEVSQDNADVRLEVLAPRVPQQTFDAPAQRAAGPEQACVASDAGSLVLRISTPDKPHGAARSLRVRILSISGMTVADTTGSLAAQCREAEAARERSPGRAGGFTADELADYQEAASLWSALGEPRRAARAKLNAAWLETRRYEDLRAARELGLESRALFAKDGDEVGVALTTLQLIVPRWEFARRGLGENGTGPMDAGIYSRIDAELAQAEQVFSDAGLAFFSIQALAARGANQFERHEYANALATFREAVERFRAAGEGSGMARAMANMNLVLAVTGDYPAAARAFDALIPDDGANASSPAEADILNNSADTHSAAGNYPQALLQYLRALAIHESWNDTGGAARSLNGVAGTYMRLGDPAAALDYSDRAANRAAAGSQDKLVSLLVRGEALRALGRFAEANASHEQALRIAHGPVMQIRVRLELVRDALAAADTESAAQQVAEAFDIDAPDSRVARLRLLLECARLSLLDGKADVAAREFSALRGKFAALGLDAQELDVSHGLALAQFAQSRFSAALDANEQTLRRLQSMVRKVGDPELRTRLTASHRDAHELRVEVLLAMRKQAATPARRTALLQRIFAAADAAQSGLVGEMIDLRSIKAESSQLRELVNQIAMREHLLAGIAFGANPPPRADELGAELALLRTRYAALGGAAPNQVVNSEKPYGFEAIPADTAILVFLGAARGLHRFAITRNGIREVELASPELVANAVDAALGEMRKAADTRPALEALSRLVLADASGMTGHKRWIVVADNMTAHVPFAALDTAAGEVYRPLIADRELTHALTVRDALALARATDTERRSPLRKVAVFSDPVFTRLDQRVQRQAVRREESLFVPILRLASSKREGDEIATALGVDRVVAYSGFDATREAALGETLLDADTLHFATHAVASDAWPNGSGLLLTGSTPDGLPLNGFLSTLDLLSRRTRTDLVVLGACDTARGESTAAENVSGLARAFLGGGARRVVATRWAVNDHATATLMRDFYLRQAAGESTARALSGAQAAMAANPKSRDPRVWAVFVLYERGGDGLL